MTMLGPCPQPLKIPLHYQKSLQPCIGGRQGLNQNCRNCATRCELTFAALGRMTTRRSMSWATVDQHSGERLAKACRRLKIPIREYLCSIVPDLANFPSIVSQS